MTYIRSVFCAVLFAFTLTAPLTAFAQVSTTTVDTSLASNTVTIDPHNSADVEAYTRSYFADVPVMSAIAKCESNFRQYSDSGAVLNGGSGGMIGVFQVNKSVHAKFALTLGDDISTLQGNEAYARYLYTNEGTTPWDSSESCWSNAILPAAKAIVADVIQVAVNAVVPDVPKAQASTVDHTSTAKVSTTLTTNLKLGAVSSQVVALQQLLNGDGYIIAKSGAGSPGNETTKFGAMTKAAVERFQCAQNIACKGTESSTGYGYVGAKTRAALAAASQSLAIK